MDRIQLTKNFYLDEYIPHNLYVKYAASHPNYLLGLLDENLITADQKLRDLFGPIVINNWFSGGERQWSGIRVPESSYYSYFSQHSFGRASDKLFSHKSAEEVRDYIRKHWQELGITAIETDVSWVHSDMRYIPNQKALITFSK